MLICMVRSVWGDNKFTFKGDNKVASKGDNKLSSKGDNKLTFKGDNKLTSRGDNKLTSKSARLSFQLQSFNRNATLFLWNNRFVLCII